MESKWRWQAWNIGPYEWRWRFVARILSGTHAGWYLMQIEGSNYKYLGFLPHDDGSWFIIAGNPWEPGDGKFPWGYDVEPD